MAISETSILEENRDTNKNGLFDSAATAGLVTADSQIRMHPSKVVNCTIHVVACLMKVDFQFLILEYTNHSVICITRKISHSFCTEVL